MLKQYLVLFIGVFFGALEFAVFARILMSWIPGDSAPSLRSFLRSITEPIMRPAREIIPTLGMFDLSPIVVLILIGVVKDILLSLVSSI